MASRPKSSRWTNRIFSLISGRSRVRQHPAPTLFVLVNPARRGLHVKDFSGKGGENLGRVDLPHHSPRTHPNRLEGVGIRVENSSNCAGIYAGQSPNLTRGKRVPAPLSHDLKNAGDMRPPVSQFRTPFAAENLLFKKLDACAKLINHSEQCGCFHDRLLTPYGVWCGPDDGRIGSVTNRALVRMKSAFSDRLST